MSEVECPKCKATYNPEDKHLCKLIEASPKITKKQAIRQLWEMGNLDYKLKGKQPVIKQALVDGMEGKSIHTVLASRRLGKCLIEGTEVITTKGIKKIENLIPNHDYVYGYNYDGTISPTLVIGKEYQGEKEVLDLLHNRKVIATSTPDHRWLTTTIKKSNQCEEKETKHLASGHRKIVRYFVDSPCGVVNEPHAYIIAALLGDGCSKQGINGIHISSEDNIIPKYCSELLDCSYYRNSEKNYTWVLSYNEKRERGASNKGNKPAPNCNYYLEWCKGRYAHEKIVDLDVIKTWNRESCLKFLAGLIDTDGSVIVTNKDNCLNIQFCSQSYSIMESFQFLFHQLFQYKPNIHIDKRAKYKNGFVYCISVKNNLFCKRAIKELDPYIQLPRKKWKQEYTLLNENNTNPKFVGAKLENPRKERTWDIEVNNESHMYLLANGLVTHNSFVLVCLAVETCVKNKRGVVKYACPEQKQVDEILRQIMPTVLEDCPPHLKPEWVESKKRYIFPNGSEIQIAAVDNKRADSLRGGSSLLSIVDEAGFCSELNYVVYNVLFPTTLTTKGNVILASTPNPKEPMHEFHTSFVIPLLEKRELKVFTIYDAHYLTEEDIDKIAENYPQGKEDPQFLCEYMCQMSTDQTSMVIPEFTEVVEKDVVKQSEMPPFYDCYVSGDPAAKDLTHVLFAYYDFYRKVVVIEDELILCDEPGNPITTLDIANGIKRKEKILFFDKTTKLPITPTLRIMDNSHPILMNDLRQDHNLNFIPTLKDNKEQQIDKLRRMVATGTIEINPRCKQLLFQLRSTKWKINSSGVRKGFCRARGDEKKGIKHHHGDGIDALLYLIRNINYTRNPYPEWYGELSGSHVFESRLSGGKDSKIKEFMETIINIRKKK